MRDFTRISNTRVSAALLCASGVAMGCTAGTGLGPTGPVASTDAGGGGSGAGGSSGAVATDSGGSASPTSGGAGTGGNAGGSGGAPEAGVVADAGSDALPPVSGPDAAEPGPDAAEPGPDAAQSPCTGVGLSAGNSNLSIPFDGGTRTYVMHVPASYTGKTRVPLVIDMHGANNGPQQEIGGSGWLQKGDAVGFVTVFPQAPGGSWNAGTCCAPNGAPPLQTSTADDVGFIRAVVNKTAQDGCIDLKRVYAVGLSNGGLMSYRLACMATDLFAGIAPVSGASVTTPCTPSRPITVVAFRGTMDATVPYNGGMPASHLWPSAKADFDLWSMLNHCTDAMPTTSRNVCQTNSQCAGGVEVTLCSIVGPHTLYGAAAAAGLAVPNVAWDIFQRHAVP